MLHPRIDTERDFAIRHAKDAYRIYKDFMCTLPAFSVVMEGYRFDDDNGISVFLSYSGEVKGTGNG